ncbi:BadF/BadG/BcrA/BcrD ATPase family protein [Aestuariibacter sp. A3R04]|uniref:BadF/BadG/BcrA/BcrD ATPase family protein n=1 Tax=Aestuariibacter sp. A3R04 TaxID=2841571 RepID=UPI001C082900|nr:BadF/BadG/BcrA/BcrD ATPase family protein [Aestuariibacter sp. A3R04]MBU3023972.1 hypothetical protein [Aestuariibacter sp. A3R04]
MQGKTQFNVGVDGGGTKCRAEIFDNKGSALGAGIGGPANVARVGEKATGSIVDAVTRAIEDAGLAGRVLLSQCRVSAGLAGATVEAARQMLDQWRHPFATFSFITDLHAAVVGAHGGKKGAVMVVGTGSCTASYAHDKVQQYGGHGFTLGDKGSGAWLGCEAVKATLEALDGVAPSSALTQAVCEFYDAYSTGEFVNKLNNGLPAEFARVAPLVFEFATRQDPIAGDLVHRAASYLSAIAERALSDCEGNLVLIGGLSELVRPYLNARVQRAIVPAQFGPEWGAVLLDSMRVQ